MAGVGSTARRWLQLAVVLIVVTVVAGSAAAWLIPQSSVDQVESVLRSMQAAVLFAAAGLGLLSGRWAARTSAGQPQCDEAKLRQLSGGSVYRLSGPASCSAMALSRRASGSRLEPRTSSRRTQRRLPSGYGSCGRSVPYLRSAIARARPRRAQEGAGVERPHLRSLKGRLRCGTEHSRCGPSGTLLRSVQGEDRLPSKGGQMDMQFRTSITLGQRFCALPRTTR